MLLKDNMIAWVDADVKDAEQGIILGCEILKANNIVGEWYEKEVIEITNKYGPYYIIAPNIALLHVSPKNEIAENSIGFTYFKNPIPFKNDEDSKVRFCLSLVAKDTESHLSILAKVAELFGNKKFLSQIDKTKNLKNLIKVMRKYDK